MEVEETLGSVTQIDNTSSSATTVPLRSSARVSKKKLDSLIKVLSPLPVEKRENDKGDPPEEAEKVPSKKPVMWPMEEKDLFFEAVNEYGKDFTAIQRYFVLKNKNKGGTVRTKEQIRRFYYRMWAKISPKLHFPPHIPKKTQELYGLINYGELCKKCKGRTKKDALRLNELIIRGFTQIRGKNKTMIVRTPRCRVLRRLCRVEENVDVETKLPSSIRVELMPADNHTWAHVQGLAQNPRVNAHVPLQCRLSSLLLYLQRRFLHRHDKYKLKIMEQYDGDAGVVENKPVVLLTAKPNAETHVAHINLNHYNSHTKICLSSYEEMLGKKGESLAILNKLYAELGTKVKKLKSENIDRDRKVDGESKEDSASCEVSDVSDSKQDDSVCSQNMDISINEVSTTVTRDEVVTEDEDLKETSESGTTAGAQVPDNDELETRLKEGLTVANCHALTIGDVYLMVGSDFKLQLDYRIKSDEVDARPMSPLSTMLSRLVRLAAMSRTRPPTQCNCRHQCPESKRPRKDSINEEATLGIQLNTIDTTFRRPPVQIGNRRIAQGAGRIDAEAFRAQMDKLTPKYCNRRGRGISNKTVVVQRTLPILPKITNSAPVIKVLPQILQICEPVVTTSENFKAEDTVETDLPPSPTPSITTLLCEPFKPFSGESDVSNGAGESACPVREEWLSEVTECSLSSLLNHLETPNSLKSDTLEPTPPDVDSQFHYLLADSSLDFTAKFAALAAEVTSESSQ